MLNEPLAEACDALLQHVPDIRATADRYPSLSSEARIDAVAEVLDFLDYHLAPRIVAEERTLFPLMARALHAPCDVETLVQHHATIGELTRALRTAEPDDVSHVQEVLRALADVVERHLGAEREVVLPDLRVR
jgi:Hemerythrin HHE cation binding domain